MKNPETDALRLVPVPYVVLSEAAGLLDCEGYGPLALTLNNLLAAALASPLPGGGWQDISTLPQKGAFTPLVDVWATGPGKDSDVSHYRITDCWRREDGVWFSMGIGELKQSRVTHWMPLPAAPTGDARNGKGEGQ